MKEDELKRIQILADKYPFKLDHFYKKLGIDEKTISDYYIKSMLEDLNSGICVILNGPGEVVSGFSVYTKSQFDTEILGLETARIKYLISSQNDGAEIKNVVVQTIDSFKKNGIQFATYRFNALDATVSKALTDYGFVRVDDYIILTRETKKTFLGFPHPEGIKVRQAEEKDVEILQDNHAHTFTYSRFFNDPALSHEVATKMHRVWIANSFAKKVADEVFVAVDGNDYPIGFITLQEKQLYGKTFGHVPLIAIKVEFSGKKVGRLLMEKSFKWFMERGINYILIETQGSNISALRSYSHMGFEEIGMGVTYSWFNKKS